MRVVEVSPFGKKQVVESEMTKRASPRLHKYGTGSNSDRVQVASDSRCAEPYRMQNSKLSLFCALVYIAAWSRSLPLPVPYWRALVAWYSFNFIRTVPSAV